MSERIIIVGAGGNARVLVDMIQRGGRFEIAGLIDDSPSRHGADVFGHQVLGGRELLASLQRDGVRYAVNAVGSAGVNDARNRVFADLVAMGFAMPQIVHPTAILGCEVEIGAGVLLMAGVIVNPGARLGANVLVNTGTVIEHDCVLEDDVFVGPGCALAGATHVGHGAFIGVGAKTIQGIHIGPRAVVAGGAMVIRDVPPAAMVAGVPAIIRSA
jgi:UDP-perosamine 4-acetyltransferase